MGKHPCHVPLKLFRPRQPRSDDISASSASAGQPKPKPKPKNPNPPQVPSPKVQLVVVRASSFPIFEPQFFSFLFFFAAARLYHDLLHSLHPCTPYSALYFQLIRHRRLRKANEHLWDRWDVFPTRFLIFSGLSLTLNTANVPSLLHLPPPNQISRTVFVLYAPTLYTARVAVLLEIGWQPSSARKFSSYLCRMNYTSY